MDTQGRRYGVADGVVRISVESPLRVVTSLEVELPVANGQRQFRLTADGKVLQAATTVGRQPGRHRGSDARCSRHD
jgi:hypothetical protein